MKWRLLCGSILMFGLLFIHQAKAGLYLEPYVGAVAMADGDQKLSGSGISGVNHDLSYSVSPLIGGRIGFNRLGLVYGLDLSQYTSHKVTSENSGATWSWNGTSVANGAEENFKASQQSLGLFVGYNAPLLVRAWAAFYPHAVMEVEESSPSGAFASGDQLKGSGFALGAGIRIIPLVTLNLEMRSYSYDADGEVMEGSGVKYDIETKEYIVSASLPIAL